MIITLTAGTGLIMWFAELVTERGVGNGMSILIFTSIAATFPAAMWAIAQARSFEVFLLVLAVGIVVVALVVFVEQSQRRIPVQYAKRMVGRRTLGGTNTYIPIKVNMAGVVPSSSPRRCCTSRAHRAVQPDAGCQRQHPGG
jgi:preprotein translocase subunit SecY